MLYEVITQYSNIFFVKTNTIFDEETKNCIGYQGIARDISEEERNLARITSYNVCYTKLLRYSVKNLGEAVKQVLGNSG